MAVPALLTRISRRPNLATAYFRWLLCTALASVALALNGQGFAAVFFDIIDEVVSGIELRLHK